jgi:uncharacterized LabA/DUF88 family protein
MPKQRVIAYIDGFNLFYSSLKGTGFKWLDLVSLCESMLKPEQELISVKYFSALVGSFKGDTSRTDRQRFYLEALRTNPKVEIKLGYFSTHRSKMPIADDFYNGKITLVDVIKTEEKGTDVNLAVQMAVDAVRDEFDYAMLFSNDSDMAYAVQIASRECNKKVGLYIARKAVSFKVLRKNVSYIRSITPAILANNQFPDEIKTQNGRVIKKPKDWY